MQKTYRSKKDANDALDPKEILYGCEESAFNALYINNIKQTRRELSCFGSSNQHFLPLKKSNKRKYVKRLGREMDIETRSSTESTSKSTFLTPDKSIHVNKGSDLFDQLLKTSASPKSTLSAKKDDLFDQFLSKQDPNFTQSPLSESVINKINRSTDTEDEMDIKCVKKVKKKQKKKNPKNIKFKAYNESNINDYDLIVEQENRKNIIDNSITNISEKPLLKGENMNNNNDICVNTPIKLKYKKNRLTENIVVQSPSTSTPMFKKYRSQSIYQYSPIVKDNPAVLNTIHDTSSENENKENKSELKNFQDIINSENNSILNISSKEVSQEFSPILQKSLYFKHNHFHDKNKNYNKNVEDANTSIILNSDIFKYKNQIANEMFFSKENQTNYIKNITVKNDIIENRLSSEKICETINNSLENITNFKEKLNINDQLTNISNKSTSLNLSLSQESFLGFTCNSVVMQNSVSIDYCNNENKPRKKSSQYQVESSINTTSVSQKESKNTSKDLFNSIESINNESITLENSGENSNTLQISSPNNNTCFFDAQSHDSGVNNNSSAELKKQCLIRQPFVQLLKLEVFNKSDNNSEILNQSLLSISLESNVSTNYDNINENTCLQNITPNNHSKLTLSNRNDNYEANNTTYMSNSSDESIDRCISFVTTRRRNEVTNHSVCFLNNFSLNSSSDKTVVSLNDGENIDDGDNVNICSKKIIEANNLVNNYELNYSVVNLSNDCFNKHDISMPSYHSSTNKSLNISKEQKYSDSESNEDISISEENKSDMHDNDEEKYINNEIIVRSNSLEEAKTETISSIKTTNNKEIKGQSERWTENYSRPPIILQPGKKWERSLSIYKRMTMANDHFETSIVDDHSISSKGRKYRQSVIETMELQDQDSIYKDPQIVRKSFWPTVTIVNESNFSSTSLCKTRYEDISGFLRQDCDDTLAELSKLSIGSSDQDITVIEKESSVRVVTARDYVLRRCEQTDAILFDECYPDTLLKNCHKIGEGVYGEVFLWRARDGSVRVLKVIPVAGNIKVNGEQQKDFNEIISEIVIAMELSALRTPIAELESHFADGKDISTLDLQSIQNATDVFNEVIGVKCVYGSYPSRLLDLWDLYDECKGSENDNPAILPVDQQFIVLELANAGQDLESYQFTNAEQAYALFIQIAFGLAVGEEAFQFEHRDLHWGNVLIAPTDQKWSLFVIRGRTHRVRRCGVRATIIDYSLSRLALAHEDRVPAHAALYNDLANDTALFSAHGDYQFEVYRLMQDRLRNDWKNFEPYTNILWLHYTVDKMITALRYKRVDTKIHKQYINKLKGIRNRILNYESSLDFVLTDNEY